jgi:hypothetical protein
MPTETDRILRGPNLAFPQQHLGFRLPEEPLPPPTWCKGPRAGNIPGGGMSNPNTVQQWWVDFADPGDQFVVRLVAEDIISGTRVRRSVTRLECRLKTDVLDAGQARKMAAVLSTAADIVDNG